MAISELGNALYFGVLGSFCGGWVPIRSKNIKLIVFHLYVFLSLLVLPLLISLVNGRKPIGWIVYSVFTGAWFIFLKVINYRLHKALGNDPEPENEDENRKENGDSKNENEDPKEKEDSKDENVDSKDENEDPKDENEDPKDDSKEENEDSKDENEDSKDDNEDYNTSLDAVTTPTLTTPDLTTPTIELSTISHEKTDEASVVNRERVCQRMRRNSSIDMKMNVDGFGEGGIIDQVNSVLMSNNQLLLLQVVNKMPMTVHQAIISGTLTSENYVSLSDRVGMLKRGHYSSDEEDYTTGSIHWFEENGIWDFYTFDQEEDDQYTLTVQNSMDVNDTWRNEIVEEQLPFPPTHVQPVVSSDTVTPAINCIKLLPFVKWSTVELKFARTQLEDYMDRNVSILEMILSICLSVLVCIVTSLLFILTNFFTNFWLFWLCFVVATCHFSLIKSVQSDAASPGPGQNRINAISRAAYYILVASLGLIFNYVITTDITSFCIFGFDINNTSVLLFVKNGLFIFLLFFPLLFTIGWMPQFDTFLINLLEQIDVHIFGGTASTGLVCSIYAVVRSILSVLLLIPLGYAGFYYLEKNIDDISINCDYTFTTFIDTVNDQHCTPGGRISLSFLLGGVVSIAYVLSRSTSNHQYLLDIFQFAWMKISKSKLPYAENPLDKMYRNITLSRFKIDIFVVICIFMIVTIINITSAFCQSVILYYSIVSITVLIGIINHYLLPHARKENPYLCFTQPCLKSPEYSLFEVTVAPKLSFAEKILQVSIFLEKNVLYPLVFLIGINLSAVYYKTKFGNIGSAILIAIVGIKIFRTSYTNLSRQHIILTMAVLFFNFDYRHLSEGLALDYFIMAILVDKIYDLYLKTYFMFIYIIPSSWSHPFHIIIQPLLIPHCPVIYFQTVIGAIISAPMNPVTASPMFFMSYARPIKFWEKNYNTKRRDITNTRLDQTLDGNMTNPNPDHLDSLFYEQLTWSLQRDLCGDMTLGRWGRVTSGDIFILTNDQLNALVHIIEVGNGFVTFQLRGLEFRGTYCHQREREAITEPLTNDDDSCHLPFVLPCKKLCISRWMAWEVISSAYTLHGYSITENQANLVFNAYIYKKAFITYYVRCIIYYIIKSPRLNAILNNTELRNTLVFLSAMDACDVDPLFTSMYNTDWNHNTLGINRQSFITAYYEMIKICVDKRNLSKTIDSSKESFLVTICFAFSLLGRRMFFTHANSGTNNRSDNFMHGLYRMFIGDARPNSDKDDWIFQDIDSIQDIIIPASRITLKIHQDNFTMAENYESPNGMYEAMVDAETNHIITHENDRSWRDAVIMNKPSLLALRYQRSDDTYINPYKIIRLNSKFVKFRLVKVNRECVRGLWSSQQHELIFLRNSDSERGSIQNHKASLRNMINSSMDLPIGYPIYVSPLQTSFLDLHSSFNNTIIGKAINPLEYIKIIDNAHKLCNQKDSQQQSTNSEITTKSVIPSDEYIDPFGETDSDDDDDFWKPMWVSKQVIIIDVNEVFETFNDAWLKWPDKLSSQKATKTHWKQWRPIEGITTGHVIHEWRPFHIQSTSRSHIDKVIVLIKVDGSDNLVLIKEQGIQVSS